MSLAIPHSLQKLLLISSLLFLALAFAESAHSAAYMKLGDIKGESTAKDHKEWILIESVSISVARASDTATPADAVRGGVTATTGNVAGNTATATRIAAKRQYEPVIFSKRVDKSSPLLQEASQKRKTFKSAILEMDDPARPGQMLRYEMENVMITSYRASPHDGSSDTTPVEEVSFTYNKIRVIEP